MRLEQIKDEILSQHQALRDLLTMVGGLAMKVTDGDVSSEPTLRQAAHLLAEALAHHMKVEEKHLAALSRGGGPHWARHLEDFKRDHVHQHALLAHFTQRVDSVRAPQRLGEIIQAMTTAVLLDIEHEEQVLFKAEHVPTALQGF